MFVSEIDWRKQEWATKLPSELNSHLINWEHDTPEEPITLRVAVEEAKYILTLFDEGGHAWNEALESTDKEERKEAQSQKRQLKAFVKKYSK